MTKWQIATHSFWYYWRANLAVILGVAAATAVLTGALIVGDSMRNSLRELTLDRLGEIDELIVSDGFFRQQLADEIAQNDVFKQHYSQAIPLILFPNGTVESSLESAEKDGQDMRLRASNINVIAVTPEFWNLDPSMEDPALSGYQVAINAQLARELLSGLDLEETTDPSTLLGSLTLRIPKPTQLPADSALGKTDDLVESFVDLEIVKVLPNKGLGRFGLHPSQTDAANIYISIEPLQEALCQTALKHKGDPAFANVILLAGKNGVIPSDETTRSLKKSLRPSLADFGLTIKRATQNFEGQTVFDYFTLSSDRLVLSDDAVNSIKKAIPNADEVFTYLANDIRKSASKSGVPFSMVASIDFDESFTMNSVSGKKIERLAENQIVLNEWAAEDLGVKVGDEIELEFFEPETTHGQQVETTTKFILADIAKLTEPAEPFQVRRREQVIPAVFDSLPTTANDPNLTPEVPGVTDAETIESWDLPFETADKIRPADDDYWNNHRTTPKAFVSLAAGQQLWGSRFGKTTSFRIPVETGSQEEIRERLLDQFVEDETKLGFELIPIKRNGLKASSGSTPFDVLFLALSMFVIAAALILVSLLFRLGLQSRASEVGLMQATGFEQKAILGIWLREMLFVCGVGAILGLVLGIGYAALMILGLKTLWVEAIANPFLDLYIGPISLIVGLLSGISICILTIWWSLRRTRKQPVSGLLAGELESTGLETSNRKNWWTLIAIVLAVGAIVLSIMAISLAGDAQAGAFMGSGFLLLTALLMMVFGWLSKQSVGQQTVNLSLAHLALVSAKRNPLRSTLTIGLVAVASFLIAAVSSFRLSPTDAGTAGFDLVAESSQPIFADLNTEDGQTELLGKENHLPDGTQVFAMRLKPGQDASCNNLYQSTQPRVLAVTQDFIDRFDADEMTKFAWGATEAETEAEKANPWQLLNRKTEDGAIPVIIDKNTANYSLKIFATGGLYTVTYDSGETVTFRVVGFLSNTILQGSLTIAEKNFTRAFPNIGGYRYFLINSDAIVERGADRILESRLSDQGFDARSAPEILAGFMKVQNNYLKAFQSLGALGLLLGTFGLGAVQIRNVIERKRELGLMRAVGFARDQLSKMVLLENAWLLILGMATGIVSAIFATLPHYLIGSASVPWLQLAIMFATIALVGLLSGLFASRLISKLPLLESLRA